MSHPKKSLAALTTIFVARIQRATMGTGLQRNWTTNLVQLFAVQEEGKIYRSELPVESGRTTEPGAELQAGPDPA